MATDNERVNSRDLLVAEYDQAEEHGRAAFSRENFHGSVKSWTEAARLAALLNRQDLVAKAYRHIGFAFHGMGELDKADHARKLAFEAEGNMSPYKKSYNLSNGSQGRTSPAFQELGSHAREHTTAPVLFDLDLKESSGIGISSMSRKQGPLKTFSSTHSNALANHENFNIVTAQHKIGSLESLRKQQRHKISQLNELNSDLDASVKSFKNTEK